MRELFGQVCRALDRTHTHEHFQCMHFPGSCGRDVEENNGRSLSGIDVGVVCGPRLDDRADIFSTTFGNNIASVGVSKVAGTSFDICFASE